MPTLGQKAAAEAIGTFILVFFGGMAAILNGSSLLLVALAFGLALAGAIQVYGKISGGHYNPAVSIAMLVTGRMSVNETLVYLIAQILGAALAGVLHGIIFDFEQAFITVPTANFVPATVAEVVGTFLLISVIFGVAVDKRADSNWAPWMIGMVVSAGILALGPVSGASFNPAVSLGPRLIATLTDVDAQWDSLPIYIIGPLSGVIVGALLYDLIAQPKSAK